MRDAWDWFLAVAFIAVIALVATPPQYLRNLWKSPSPRIERIWKQDHDRIMPNINDRTTFVWKGCD